MSENKKCPMCGKDNATIEMSNSSFYCGPENCALPTKITPIYICKECAKEHNDRLESYCDWTKTT